MSLLLWNLSGERCRLIYRVKCQEKLSTVTENKPKWADREWISVFFGRVVREDLPLRNEHLRRAPKEKLQQFMGIFVEIAFGKKMPWSTNALTRMDEPL